MSVLGSCRPSLYILTLTWHMNRHLAYHKSVNIDIVCTPHCKLGPCICMIVPRLRTEVTLT